MTCCRMDGFARWCQCAPGREEHLAAAYRSCVHHPEHPDSLRTWLLEQIAEDERRASEPDDKQWRFEEPTLSDGHRDTDAALRIGTRIVHCDDHGQLEAAEAEHAAAWDPARVLAECDAKRRIVELHTGEHECSVYDHDGEIDHCQYVLGDCSTLRLLALPYADRDGYREEWRL